MNVLLSKLPKIVNNKAKRLGRGTGSGKGAKSGRGTTRHQAARENIPITFEGGQGRMVKRFPLLRGKCKNKAIYPKPRLVKLSALAVFNDGDLVDLDALLSKNLIAKGDVKTGVKILFDKKIERKLDIRLPCSKKVFESLHGSKD